MLSLYDDESVVKNPGIIMKVGVLARNKLSQEVKNHFEQSNACLFIGINKIPSAAVSSIRNDLRRNGAEVFVTKNTLFKRVFEEFGHPDAQQFIQGETGAVFIYENDIIGACKVLADFSKENENFQVRGGILQEKSLSQEEFQSLAKLPPKEVLLGTAVRGLASPLTGFVSVLNQTIQKFVWLLEEMKKKKDQESK
ncbi:MAG: 50S ribosomal protein L10 [Candidatus Omnitrophica bacterium]|nr:50S ribosomal protein L10 [Candidatus Omnitrophota bacterium]